MSNSNAKLAAGVLGGYVLGRTKKGKAAIRLAMWISNNRGPLSNATSKVVKDENVSALMAQIQGPLMEAIQQAALNAATARMEQLSGNLTKRTALLGQVGGKATAPVGDVTEQVADSVAEPAHHVADAIPGLVKAVAGRAKKRPKEEPAPESAESEEPKEEAKPKPSKETAQPEADDSEDDSDGQDSEATDESGDDDQEGE